MTINLFHDLYPERRVLKEADYPLLERVLLGPIEDEAKIFIMEKDKTHEVSSEVNKNLDKLDYYEKKKNAGPCVWIWSRPTEKFATVLEVRAAQKVMTLVKIVRFE